MFTPTYSITHLILSYIVKYEISMEKIRSSRLPLEHSNNLYEKLHSEDIDKLGELIGHSIGYNKALETQRGKLLPSSRTKFRLFTNYRSIHDFIDSYSASQFITPSSDLIIHLNKLLLKRLTEEWNTGKIRSGSEKPNEIYDTWYKYREFYPGMDFKQHFNEVFEWINNPPMRINKLIQLAILLYELIDKAPLLAGNQITSILTLATVAKEYGYNPDNIIPFAKSVQSINEDLISAYKMAKSSRDQTVFIEAFLYTLSLSGLSIENQINDLLNTKVKKHNKLKTKFNERQIQILDFLDVEKKVTRKKYTKMMGVSFMTSYRDLQELLDEGYIKQEGLGRGTFYTLPKREDVIERDEIMVIGD